MREDLRLLALIAAAAVAGFLLVILIGLVISR